VLNGKTGEQGSIARSIRAILPRRGKVIMVWSMDQWNTLRRAAAKGVLLAGLIGLLAAGVVVSFASAQDTPATPAQPQSAQPKAPKPVAQPAPAAQAPAAQAPAAGAAPAPAAAGAAPAAGGAAPAAGADQTDASWVKLCEKSPQTDNKEICLTHHERVDGNSGMVLVAAAVRKIEGDDKQQLLVRLPTAIALAIPAGVQIRVDEGEPVALKYTLCYQDSCQAETELTKELFDTMRNGKQMVVAAVNLQRKAIGFPVPLGGFAKSYDGPPVDNAKYQEARRQLMELIHKRQVELANKAAEAEQKKGQGGQAGAPDGGQAQAGTPAPAQQPAATGTPAQTKKPTPPPTP
jgi:invasion protein IalB